MTVSLSSSIPTITVRNTTDRPQPVKAEDGQTITIMPNSVTQISAVFASSLPRAVRIMS